MFFTHSHFTFDRQNIIQRHPTKTNEIITYISQYFGCSRNDVTQAANLLSLVYTPPYNVPLLLSRGNNPAFILQNGVQTVSHVSLPSLSVTSEESHGDGLNPSVEPTNQQNIPPQDVEFVEALRKHNDDVVKQAEEYEPSSSYLGIIEGTKDMQQIIDMLQEKIPDEVLETIFQISENEEIMLATRKKKIKG